nr:WAP four-disulfide core domain protein 12-like [Pogona vitticeps]
MKTLSTLVFFSLLMLWMELPYGAAQETEYPSNCPPDPYVCIRAEPNECEKNRDCKDNKICCQNTCAKRCVYPVKG